VLILNDGRPGRTAAFGGSLQRPGLRVPVLALSSAAGADLARGARPRVRLVVRTVSETRSSSNVIAEVGAREPRRIVMAGAHLDSVDEGPGINDNGSGVSAVLEVAEDLTADAAQLPQGTQLRFGFWAAEELGLYGSRHYVARLDAGERRAHVAYVNLDMVGTPDGSRGVYRGRDETGRRIERLLRSALGGRIRAEQLGGASDHAPFARAGIPVGGLFTGTDRCYHRRCDTAANVDRELLAEMTRAARIAVGRLARG
jgi:Zn-dependent M28 family amino/carboxypeptidase